MTYIISHTHRDGHIERAVNTIDGSSPGRRLDNMAEGLALTRKHLHDKKGWTRDKKMRLVARIPAEVVNHCLRNHGSEAARDTKFLMRHADRMGINCRVSRGRF